MRSQSLRAVAVFSALCGLVISCASPAATAVDQNGPITAGHVASWTSPGVIQDGGSATAGLLTELGITKNGGCALGINTGPLSAPFNEICAGVDSTGGYLSVNNFGGGSPPTLRFIINGVTYPFTGGGGGSGNVTGPSSSTDGDIAVFNGATGKIIRDGGVPLVATISPISFGTSLFPFYQNGHQITATTTTGSNTFTASDTTYAVIGAMIYGRFANGSYVQSVSGSTVTVANYLGSPNSTLTGSGPLSFGFNRWDPTSNVLANDIAAKEFYAGAAAVGSSTPAARYRPWKDFQNVTSLDAQSPNGQIGGYFFSRTSDSGGSATAEAFQAQCIQDNPLGSSGCWAVYLEPWNVAGAAGTVFGIESSTVNLNTEVSEDPFNVNTNPGTHNVRLDCGNGVIASLRCTSALEVLTNGSTFLGGAAIVGNGALDTSTYTHPDALEMPSGTNGYSLAWFSASQKRVWNIYSDTGSTTTLGNDIALHTNSITVDDATGQTHLQVLNASPGVLSAGLVAGNGAANYIQLQGSTTGGISAIASTGNVDAAPPLRIVTGNTTGATSGYVNIEDAAYFFRTNTNTSQTSFSGSTTGLPTIGCRGVTNCAPELVQSGTGVPITLNGTVKIPALASSACLGTDSSGNIQATSCSGSSGVTGPGSSVNGDFAVFSGTSGGVIADGGTPGTAAFGNTGTSGATIPLLNGSNTTSGNNTHSGTETFSSTVTLSAQAASSPICTNSSKQIASSGCSPNPLITSTAVTANATVGTLPANATILYAIARETAGHNVTVSLGTTSGATDVATPLTLTANTSSYLPATSIDKNWFSAGSTQAIFIDSPAWSSASVNISIYYVVGP